MFKYPKLDVKRMMRPILRNYNRHVLRFIELLKDIACELTYDGPFDIHDHIRDKTVYACSVRCQNTSDGKKKYKCLKNVFPVMIGSNLDFCIRKRNMKSFTFEDLKSTDFLDQVDGETNFHLADIAISFFIINGCVRQLPYFFTNDPTNTHVVRSQKIVRCYTYDVDDRGKELTYYVENNSRYKRGDIVVVLNDGKVALNSDDQFFDHCPYATKQKAYMAKLYMDGRFDIDNLGNKIVTSPGHLFTKLFRKYLYRPLKERDWSLIKSKHALVIKSIEMGTLLHVLSKKTVYFKESPSTMTVINNNSNRVVHSGDMNDQGDRMMSNEVYIEKNSGCYREISMQTYPLNPYISYLITRQTSSKVNNFNVAAFHSSYEGFLCIIGSFETKHIGRTFTMVRNTVISTREDLERVYENISISYCDDSSYYVVVNEACIPITKECFQQINLVWLKFKLRYVECFRDRNFIFIRYKIGLFFKKLYFIDGIRARSEWMKTIWVTARDESYWKKQYENMITPVTYDQLTGYLANLNPYFHHNIFNKNILAFNTLKNAILATDYRYLEYFMESLSAYTSISPRHQIVCEPVDSFSKRFALYIPLLVVGYMSYKGLNQEDSIVINRRTRAFDCFRFYTVRFKFDTPSRYVAFRPTTGDPDPECYLLGHLICHDNSISEFRAVPLTMHARLEAITEKIYRIYFNKSNFQIISYDLTNNRLTVCMKRYHESQTGDKLSNFHGQKGVIRTTDDMPMVSTVDAFGNERRQSPDMLVNPMCFFRVTMGPMKEAEDRGGIDYYIVYNSDGKRLLVEDYGVFVGPTLYFIVSYLSVEHIYAPETNSFDPILGQPVKGRSRQGGMRLGNMEITNGMRGNGLATCFEEKVLEHSDRIFYRPRKRKREDDDGKLFELPIPLCKSAPLCGTETEIFKCLIEFDLEPCLKEIKS